MRDSIGKKDPIVFFEKMVDVFEFLFIHLNKIDNDLHRLKTQTALSIQWDPRVASDMLSSEVNVLRDHDDPSIYEDEIQKLKKAFTDDRVTQNYNDFCKFWVETLGWHPFLDYK